jgi:hypothetical protein
LANDLGVDPLCLVVVGSTAVGISLSPKVEKQFKAYHDESDVDVAIISPAHFEEAWSFLRGLGPAANLKGSPDIADLLQWHRRSLVFDGTIATDRLLPYLPFAAPWQAAFGRAATIAPTQDRDVKARIYRSFESLREYQLRNVQSMMVEIASDGDVSKIRSTDDEDPSRGELPPTPRLATDGNAELPPHSDSSAVGNSAPKPKPPPTLRGPSMKEQQ